MTYAQLLQELQKMSPEELAKEALIDVGNDYMPALHGLAYTDED
jgi:hypothetical protein